MKETIKMIRWWVEDAVEVTAQPPLPLVGWEWHAQELI